MSDQVVNMEVTPEQVLRRLKWAQWLWVLMFLFIGGRMLLKGWGFLGASQGWDITSVLAGIITLLMPIFLFHGISAKHRRIDDIDNAVERREARTKEYAWARSMIEFSVIVFFIIVLVGFDMIFG